MLDLTATLLTIAIVGCCVLLHYESLRLLQHLFGNTRRHRTGVLFCMFGLLIAHIAEIWIFGLGYWASVYWLGIGTITPPLEEWLDAIYFSAMVYTTVGFGDLLPSGALRLLVSGEALTGLALITWSASFTFLQMQRLWRA